MENNTKLAELNDKSELHQLLLDATKRKKFDIYIRKNLSYKIYKESKYKLNGQWVPCIIYEPLYDCPDGDIFVRDKKEFFKEFKLKDAV